MLTVEKNDDGVTTPHDPETVTRGLSGAAPLVVADADREKVAADLKARLGRFDGVDTKNIGWVRQEKSRAGLLVLDHRPRAILLLRGVQLPAAPG